MKKNEAHNPWTKLSGEVKYDNPWIKITEDQVKNPAGKDGIYGVVHFKTHAVAVIPLDVNNYTWIVGQYRYPLDSYEWEIVEGGCPEGTSPVATAHRELHEEVGLKAEKMELILEMQLSNSCTDEVSYSYIARGLSYVGEAPEEDEELAIRKVPFAEVYEMVLRGEIRDALSVASILRAKILIDGG
ncbi:MAG: NUDIX hydrolase [Bacteroidetes bacterium]|nr:NUDIX hydrolase [Bacteroidota bacterium]MBK8657671.1 NUDIX hydrolase [Bacteroidota bacterium]